MFIRWQSKALIDKLVNLYQILKGGFYMKKFLSLTLALIMTLALAVPAFAVTDPTIPSDTSDEDYGIMPLASLFPQTPIAGAGTYKTYDFTASSSNGNYIRFWFENTTSEAVDVYLYRTDSGKDKLVKSMSVDGDSHNQEVYYNSTASSGTYYIKIDASESGGTISGNLSVAQYTKRPN